MLENEGPRHIAFRRSNRRSKPALQVKWLMPLERFLILGQSKKNAFRFKLRTSGHKDLPQECVTMVVKKTEICWRTTVRRIALFVVASAALQLKWLMPWELPCLIHRQSKKKAFCFKLRMFGHQELPWECAKIVAKKMAIY